MPTRGLHGAPQPRPHPPQPRSAVLWSDELLVVAGGAAITSYTDTLQRFQAYTLQSSPANGDAWELRFFLAAGRYTLALLGITGANRGMLDLYIDGALAVAGQDWYSGSTVFNAVKATTVAIPTGGAHVLRGVVNGKHASSSDYYYVLTQLTLTEVD